MQNLYQEVGSLDKRCYDKLSLSEDVLMENASASITNYIKSNFNQDTLNILIVVGSGNNGADGITTARQLYDNNQKFHIKVLQLSCAKSPMALLQEKRAKLVGVEFIKNIDDIDFTPDIIVDAIFGSGLKRELNQNIKDIIKYLNSIDCHKIACDIPSGILNNTIDGSKQICFKADVTITMGALKSQLFNDTLKDDIGDIIVADLGIDKSIYQTPTNMKVLQKSDLKLPIRDKLNSHKGSFGHTLCIAGDKEGACRLSAMAAFEFGAGLCTILHKTKIELEPYIMQIKSIKDIPSNITSITIGMGLGKSYTNNELKDILNLKCPKVFDADILYKEVILDYLQDDIILTPHPKEFISLLKLTKIANIDINELQNNRIKYSQLFCKKYPKVVLLLKGANVIVAQNEKLFINPLGSCALSKGGSGDVLSGLIGGLLAQRVYHNFDILECAINASLAHSIASQNYAKEYNTYSLNPLDLIRYITLL